MWFFLACSLHHLVNNGKDYKACSRIVQKSPYGIPPEQHDLVLTIAQHQGATLEVDRMTRPMVEQTFGGTANDDYGVETFVYRVQPHGVVVGSRGDLYTDMTKDELIERARRGSTVFDIPGPPEPQVVHRTQNGLRGLLAFIGTTSLVLPFLDLATGGELNLTDRAWQSKPDTTIPIEDEVFGAWLAEPQVQAALALGLAQRVGCRPGVNDCYVVGGPEKQISRKVDLEVTEGDQACHLSFYVAPTLNGEDVGIAPGLSTAAW